MARVHLEQIGKSIHQVNSNVRRLEAYRQERIPTFFETFRTITPFLTETRLAEYVVDLDKHATRVEYAELDDSTPHINGPYGVFSHGENTNILRMPLLMHTLDIPGCKPIPISLTGRVKSAISATVNQLATGRIHETTWVPGEIEGLMALFMTSADARYFHDTIVPKLTGVLTEKTGREWINDESLHLDKLDGAVKGDVSAFGFTRELPAHLRIQLTTLRDNGNPFEIQSYSLLPDEPGQVSGGWPVTRFLLEDDSYGMAKANAVRNALDTYLQMYNGSLEETLNAYYGKNIVDHDWEMLVKKMYLLEDLKTRIAIGSAFLGKDLTSEFAEFFKDGNGAHPFSYLFKMMKPEIFYFDGNDIRAVDRPVTQATDIPVHQRPVVVMPPGGIGSAEAFLREHSEGSGSMPIRFSDLEKYGISTKKIKYELSQLGLYPFIKQVHIFRWGEHYYPHHYDFHMDGIDANGVQRAVTFSTTYEIDRMTDPDHKWDAHLHLRPTHLFVEGEEIKIPDSMRGLYDAIGYYVLYKKPTDPKVEPLLRIDSVCTTSMFAGTGHFAAGDHHGLGCDCANQRTNALEMIYQNPGGGLSILTPHAGRGSGTDPHFGQLNIQDFARRNSLPVPPTYFAYAGQNLPPDARGTHYWVDALIVKAFTTLIGDDGVIQLLTNNTMKGGALDVFAIPYQQVPIHVTNEQARYYKESPNFNQKADEGRHIRPKSD